MTNPEMINPETGENFDPYEGWKNPPKELDKPKAKPKAKPKKKKAKAK